jgi:hypothetical protein
VSGSNALPDPITGSTKLFEKRILAQGIYIYIYICIHICIHTYIHTQVERGAQNNKRDKGKKQNRNGGMKIKKS